MNSQQSSLEAGGGGHFVDINVNISQRVLIPKSGFIYKLNII